MFLYLDMAKTLTLHNFLYVRACAICASLLIFGSFLLGEDFTRTYRVY